MIILIAVILFMIFLGPIFSIMALNTLFNLGIEFSFGTWFAMFWIHLVLSGIAFKKDK